MVLVGRAEIVVVVELTMAAAVVGVVAIPAVLVAIAVAEIYHTNLIPHADY